MSAGIKHTELRIGNWIYDFGDGDGQVQAIDADHYVLTSANDMFQPHETFIAIPLTEEWLLKFGFSNYRNQLKEYTHNRLRICQSTDDTWNEVDLCSVWIPVRFVHQLQNLYHALNGEDLFIVPSAVGKV